MRKFLEIATRPQVGFTVSCFLIIDAALIVLTGGSFALAAGMMILAGMI